MALSDDLKNLSRIIQIFGFSMALEKVSNDTYMGTLSRASWRGKVRVANIYAASPSAVLQGIDYCAEIILREGNYVEN